MAGIIEPILLEPQNDERPVAWRCRVDARAAVSDRMVRIVAQRRFLIHRAVATIRQETALPPTARKQVRARSIAANPAAAID
jgi:hypothetical protein